jgi:hypothetical protein
MPGQCDVLCLWDKELTVYIIEHSASITSETCVKSDESTHSPNQRTPLLVVKQDWRTYCDKYRESTKPNCWWTGVYGKMRVARLIQTRVWSLSDWRRSKMRMSKADWTTPLHDQWATVCNNFAIFQLSAKLRMEWTVVFVEVEARCVLDRHQPWDGMILGGHSSNVDVCYMIWSPTGSDTPITSLTERRFTWNLKSLPKSQKRHGISVGKPALWQ